MTGSIESFSPSVDRSFCFPTALRGWVASPRGTFTRAIASTSQDSCWKRAGLKVPTGACFVFCLSSFFGIRPWARWMMTAYALVANLPCILVQRYNRFSLRRIMRTRHRVLARP
jgi:hypothetical protein